MTLTVVGGMHANADGSNRLFDIALCAAGESIQLVPDPKNKHDPSAVAVFSVRGVQIGYVSAERCGWIGSMAIGNTPFFAISIPVNLSGSGQLVQLPRRADHVIRSNIASLA